MLILKRFKTKNVQQKNLKQKNVGIIEHLKEKVGRPVKKKVK